MTTLKNLQNHFTAAIVDLDSAGTLHIHHLDTLSAEQLTGLGDHIDGLQAEVNDGCYPFVRSITTCNLSNNNFWQMEAHHLHLATQIIAKLTKTSALDLKNNGLAYCSKEQWQALQTIFTLTHLGIIDLSQNDLEFISDTVWKNSIFQLLLGQERLAKIQVTFSHYPELIIKKNEMWQALLDNQASAKITYQTDTVISDYTEVQHAIPSNAHVRLSQLTENKPTIFKFIQYYTPGPSRILDSAFRSTNPRTRFIYLLQAIKYHKLNIIAYLNVSTIPHDIFQKAYGTQELSDALTNSDLNVPINAQKDTLMHVCIDSLTANIIEELANLGANFLTPNLAGHTPFDCARDRNLSTVAPLLAAIFMQGLLAGQVSTVQRAFDLGYQCAKTPKEILAALSRNHASHCELFDILKLLLDRHLLTLAAIGESFIYYQANPPYPYAYYPDSHWFVFLKLVEQYGYDDTLKLNYKYDHRLQGVLVTNGQNESPKQIAKRLNFTNLCTAFSLAEFEIVRPRPIQADTLDHIFAYALFSEENMQDLAPWSLDRIEDMSPEVLALTHFVLDKTKKLDSDHAKAYLDFYHRCKLTLNINKYFVIALVVGFTPIFTLYFLYKINNVFTRTKIAQENAGSDYSLFLLFFGQYCLSRGLLSVGIYQLLTTKNSWHFVSYGMFAIFLTLLVIHLSIDLYQFSILRKSIALVKAHTNDDRKMLKNHTDYASLKFFTHQNRQLQPMAPSRNRTRPNYEDRSSRSAGCLIL